jgi:hypothetical protein
MSALSVGTRYLLVVRTNVYVKYWSLPSVDVDGTVRISWSGREKADVGHYKYIRVRVGAEFVAKLQGSSDQTNQRREDSSKEESSCSYRYFSRVSGRT